MSADGLGGSWTGRGCSSQMTTGLASRCSTQEVLPQPQNRRVSAPLSNPLLAVLRMAGILAICRRSIWTSRLTHNLEDRHLLNPHAKLLSDDYGPGVEILYLAGALFTISSFQFS